MGHFTRKVARMREPFPILAGYGRTGELLTRDFDALGQQVVVIDASQDRVDGFIKPRVWLRSLLRLTSAVGFDGQEVRDQCSVKWLSIHGGQRNTLGLEALWRTFKTTC